MSVNVAIVRGHLTAPAEVRVLPSGRTLAVLQVATRPASGAISVPVAVWDPAGWLVACEAGTELVVVGTVRRRFFRVATSTASRVELEATSVALAANIERCERMLRAAFDSVAEAFEPAVG